MNDVEKAISGQEKESAHLEYKRTDYIKDQKTAEICKSISAFANSDGGKIIFGVVEEKSTQNLYLDNGVENVSATIEWLDSII